MFVQIHTLRDYSTALQNRGQDGLAKRSMYGGIMRQRISSQCIKAAVRDSEALVRTGDDGSLVSDTLRDLAEGLGLGMSVRSALIGDRKILPRLQNQGLADEDARAWTNTMMILWRSSTTTEASSNVPLVIGDMECAAIADMVVTFRDAGFDPAKPDKIRELFDKPTALRKAPAEVQQAIKALRALKSHAGVDGALFGRFATGVAVFNVDSCVHVAHALTVHQLDSVSDFFSVRDQLKTEEENRGGSHINTSELASGLFYGYVVVDLRQLHENFAELDDQQAAELVGWLVRAFTTVEPSAKLGATAPYGGVRECVVEIGRRQPRSLIGAFEQPVRPEAHGSLSEAARKRLAAHAEEMDGLVGGVDWRGYLRDFAGKDRPAVETLATAATEQLVAMTTTATA